MASMASGLFSSIPITVRQPFSTFCMIAAPITISLVRSSMMRKSLVRKGSHSAPLMIRHSAVFPGGGVSLTWVGKVAPPRPTTPQAFILSRMKPLSSGISVTRVSERSIPSAQVSPSTAISTCITMLPARSLRGAMPFTVPLAGEWTKAEMNPPGSAITWPVMTASPTATTGLAGAPRCWAMDTYMVLGREASRWRSRGRAYCHPDGHPLWKKSTYSLEASFFTTGFTAGKFTAWIAPVGHSATHFLQSLHFV